METQYSQYSSLREFSAHITGMKLEEIISLLDKECKGIRAAAELPQRKRKDVLALGLFHYEVGLYHLREILQGVPCTLHRFDKEGTEMRQELERIRKELETRGQLEARKAP